MQALPDLPLLPEKILVEIADCQLTLGRALEALPD